MNPRSSCARPVPVGLLLACLLASPAVAAPRPPAPTSAAQMDALLKGAYPADKPVIPAHYHRNDLCGSRDSPHL